MATGVLWAIKKTGVLNTVGNNTMHPRVRRSSEGNLVIAGSLGGQIGDNPSVAFKTGRNIKVMGVISYTNVTGSTSLSTSFNNRYWGVAFGVFHAGSWRTAYAWFDYRYWDLAIGTVASHTIVPWNVPAVRITVSQTFTSAQNQNGRTVTYNAPVSPPITPPPTPPVTPPPTEDEEDEEDEEEEEEEETPVTPTPTGINAIIQSFLTQVLTGIRTAVTTALGQITVSIPASFGTTVTALKNVVTALGTTLTTWATDAATTVSTAVTTANTSLSNAVRTGVTAVGNAISNAINSLKTALTTALTTMSTAITTAIAAIGRLVQQAITGIQTGLVNAYNRITGLITTSLGRVRNAISTASTHLVSTLNSRFRDISGVLSGLRMAVQSRINALVDTVRRQISALTLKVGELAIDFLGDIYRSGDSLWDWLVSLTGDTAQMIIRAVERILGPISEDTLQLIRDGVPRSQHDLSYGSPPPPGLE